MQWHLNITMELGCHSKKSGNVQTGDRDDENSVQESKRLETSSIKNPSRDTVSSTCAVWGDQQATCAFPCSEPATLFSLSLKKHFYCDSFEFTSLSWSPARSRTAWDTIYWDSSVVLWDLVWLSSFLTSVLFTSPLRGQWRTHPACASPKPPISAHIPSTNVHKLNPGQYAASLWLSYFVDCLFMSFPLSLQSPRQHPAGVTQILSKLWTVLCVCV